MSGATEGAGNTIQATSYGAILASTELGSFLRYRAARGTRVVPTALTTTGGLGTDVLGQFTGQGHDGTAFSSDQVEMVFRLDGSGAWTTSSHPTEIELWTTPASSTTIAKNVVVRGDGTVEFMKTVAKYNNIATVSNGVPAEYATIDTTGLTANVGSTLLYAVPSTGAGLYRVTALVVETTAASVSSTLANVQIIYTDNQTSGTITIDATPVLGVAGVGQTGALTANTVGTTSTGVIAVNAKASTNINYQTVNYASSTAGMTYALHIRLEAL